jgi:hypothetical protein
LVAVRIWSTTGADKREKLKDRDTDGQIAMKWGELKAMPEGS